MQKAGKKRGWQIFKSAAKVLLLLMSGCGFDGSMIVVELNKDVPTDTASDAAPDSSEDTLNGTGTDFRDSGAIDSNDSIATDSALIAPEDSWRFFTIADVQNGPLIGAESIRSMYTLDPEAVALIDAGDLTDNALEAEMQAYHAALESGALAAGGPADHYRTDVSEWGRYTRVIAALGNHDIYSADWLSLWNTSLSGQAELGENSEAGVYFQVSYKNMLFIILDSNHPSDAQTSWLEKVLSSEEARRATWKFAFFHSPLYSCSFRAPFGGALVWRDLFERYGVDMVVNGHLHTFERTCPLRQGKCVGPADGGVVYLAASGGGASYSRTVDTAKTVTVSFEEMEETYRCEDILEDHADSWYHFCHYTVGTCRLTIHCYDHDFWNDGKLRHQYELNKCK